MTTNLPLAALLLIALLIAGGCQTGPDDPVAGTPPPVADDEPEPEQREPREGLVDVRPHAWEDAALGEDDRTVTLTFWSGVEECYGLDRADVEEGPDEVVITLYTGRVPGDHVCIEIAVQATTTVTLDEPLGDRTLVDGAEAG
jgi:hypothetical protein